MNLFGKYKLDNKKEEENEWGKFEPPPKITPQCSQFCKVNLLWLRVREYIIHTVHIQIYIFSYIIIKTDSSEIYSGKLKIE